MDASAAPQELTDDEIRAALVSCGANWDIPVNSHTKPLLLRKIAQLRSSISSDPSPDASPISESPARDCGASSEDGFYVVACNATDRPDNMEIYRNKAAALKALKQATGARFLKFETQDEAQNFVFKQKGDKVDASNPPLVSSERANSYSSLTTPDLNKFRELIEKKELEAWSEAVWGNPRHLITQGDAPVILKPPTRYNALHCVARSGALAICRRLFEILEGDRFWSLVYPDDTAEIRGRRRDHLIDLYLNTCDKILQETPLHFACKYGHEDIVSHLLSFRRRINMEALNKYGETPSDVVCSKDCSRDPAKRSRIRDLFTAPFYVPVMRSLDNCTYPSLAAPCTLQQLEVALKSPLLESPLRSSAVAGPMSLSKARAFWQEWQTPSDRSERFKVRNVRRSDPDRGLERRGRFLAHKEKVSWRENWDFLNCSCDLAKPDGLRMLEHFLGGLHSAAPTSYSSLQDQSVDAGYLEMDSILEDFSNLSLQDPVGTPKSNSCRFITGPEPTKLDYDVLLALEDCDIDSSLYPNITSWQDLVNSYSEEEQKRWRTPFVSSGCLSSRLQEQHHTLSPLLRSSPVREKKHHAPHVLPKQLFPPSPK